MNRSLIRMLLGVLCASLSHVAMAAQTRTWEGDVNNLWTNASNWGGNNLPHFDDVKFTNNLATVVNLRGIVADAANSGPVSALLFTGSGSVWLTNNLETLTLNGGGGNELENSGTGSVTNDVAMILANGQTWGSSGGTITLNGDIDGRSSVITLTATNLFTINGNISGSSTFAINKTGGPGILYLSGNNSFTGNVLVSSGTIIVGANNALGNNTGVTVARLGGTLAFSNNVNYTTVETTFIGGTGGTSRSALDNIQGANTYNGTLIVSNIATVISSSGGSLNLGGIISNGTAQLTFSNVANTLIVSDNQISGSGGIMHTGPGTTVFAGNNTYTGATTNLAGLLIVAANNALGTAAAGTVITVGSTLGFSNNITYATAEMITLGGTGFNNQGAINNIHGVNSFAGAISNTASTVIGSSAGQLTLSGAITNGNFLLSFTNTAGTLIVDTGVISGSGGLEHTGTGTTVLGGNSTYAGVTTNSSGVLIVTANNALGAATTGTVISVGSTLGFSNNVTYAAAEMITLGGTGFNNQGAINNIHGVNSFAGAISNTASTVIGSAAGQLTLSGAITNGNFLLSFTNTAGTLIVVDGGGVISGSGGLEHTGPGTTVLGAANTYAGVTTNSGGILIVTANNALGAATTGTVISAGATLGFSNSVNYAATEALTISSTGYLNQGAINNIAGNNIFAGTVSNAAAATIQSTAGTLTLNGSVFNGGNLLTVTNASSTTITIGGMVSGTGGLTKNGPGTLALSSSNTMTGAIIINGGTLEAAATGALSAVSSLTINPAGTLLLTADDTLNNAAGVTLAGGTINSNDRSETFGALTLSAASVIVLGTDGVHNDLSFLSGTSGGQTLLISNWTFTTYPSTGTGDRLYFTSGSPSAGFLANVWFAGHGVGSIWNATTKEITPIPEPGSYVAGILLLGLMVRHLRRKKSSSEL